MTEKEFNEIKILINALAGITECKSTVQKCNNAIVILEQNKQLLLHNVSQQRELLERLNKIENWCYNKATCEDLECLNKIFRS